MSDAVADARAGTGRRWPAARRAASASRPGRRGSARRRRAPPRPAGRRDRAGADDGAVDLGRDPLDRGAAPRRVRSVTSIAGRPPRTSASASGTASSTSSITTTGTTGARETSSSTVMRRQCRGRDRTPTRRRRDGRRGRGRPRTARARCPWVAAARSDGSRSPRSTSTSSRPVSASRRTTSPSRRRDSGPPAAASGVQWIAAGTLPEAPLMRPSVTSATRRPRSISTPSAGRELVQLRHPVRARALVAHDRDVVVVELAAVEGGEEVALVVEDARRGGHDAVLGRDRADLHHRAAERAVEHADAAVGRERVAHAAAGRRRRATRARAGRQRSSPSSSRYGSSR